MGARRPEPPKPHACQDTLSTRAGHSVRIMSVLGVPVRFTSNSSEILAVLRETFGGVAAPPARDLTPLHSADVRILVRPGEERLDATSGLHSRREGRDRFVVSTPASHGIADAARMTAMAHVTPALVAQRGLFRYGVVEALTMFLVTRCDRTPFHASGVTHHGAAVLLTGSSGAGKSSLAYAVMGAGMRLITDDVVYVQLEGRTQLWSIAHQLRLPEDAGGLFPELRGVAPVAQPNAKRKVLVDVGAGKRAPSPLDCPVGVCILSPTRAASPVLERLAPEDACARMTADLEPGFDLFGEVVQTLFTRLTARGAWHLTLGPRPTSAVPLLDSILKSLAGLDE